MRRILLAGALAGLSGCVTAPAVGSLIQLDPSAGQECVANCQKLGMSLEAVVVMHNSTGCVCTPRAEGETGKATGAAGAAGGAVTAVMQAEEREQQQQSSHNMGPGPHVP